MGCRDVALQDRLLWGFLTRQGMREGEALALSLGDVDLARGAVRLDKNKTDDPRAWALDPSVARALRRYVEAHGADAAADEPLFTDEFGRRLRPEHMAKLLRQHLRAVGLEAERPELFTSTENRLRMRVHDLRGTFVTISLANGRKEAWIADRTGHRSSQMINAYRRLARTSRN